MHVFKGWWLMACAMLGMWYRAAPAADDVLFPPNEPLTAERLADAVAQRNPGLAEMRAALEEAQSRIEPAGALDDPMLSMGVAPRTFGSDLGGRSQVQITQTLPWWGTRAAREEAARAGADAAAQDVESLQLKLRATAQSAFADWAFIHRALEINQHHQMLYAELREVAKVRYAAGRAPQQDVLQADIERTVLRQQALELDARRTAIQAGINALVNQPADTPLPPPAPLSSDMDVPTRELLESLARERHPMIRQLEAQQRAAEARVTVAEKARYPELRLNAGYNSLWENHDLRPTVGISINVPIDQGKRGAEINGAMAHVRRVEQALADQRARLTGELAAAYAAVDEARQSLALYQNELLPLADNTLAVARSDYASGQGDFLNVITAERHRLDTDLGLARTQAQLFQRLAELGRLAGTSFPFDSAPAAR